MIEQIAVVGDGIVGKSLALALLKDGKYKISLVCGESHSSRRVSTLTPSSYNFLNQLGVDFVTCPFKNVCVWDQNSFGRLNFQSSRTNEVFMGRVVYNQAVDTALTKALDAYGLTCYPALKSWREEEGAYRLQFCDGKEVDFSFIVGADGAQSRVRSLAGIGEKIHDYRQTAIVGEVLSEASFEESLWQRFVDEGVLAMLPLEERLASFVWSLPSHRAEHYLSCDANAFERAITSAFESRFGAFRLKGERSSFPLRSMRVSDYGARGVVLIGDALHQIHPLAGQGLNLGLADVLALASLIKAERTLVGNTSLASKLSKMRRADNELMEGATRFFDWVYRQESEIWRHARGAGMRLIDNLPVFKRFLSQRAMERSVGCRTWWG